MTLSATVSVYYSNTIHAEAHRVASARTGAPNHAAWLRAAWALAHGELWPYRRLPSSFGDEWGDVHASVAGLAHGRTPVPVPVPVRVEPELDARCRASAAACGLPLSTWLRVVADAAAGIGPLAEHVNRAGIAAGV